MVFNQSSNGLYYYDIEKMNNIDDNSRKKNGKIYKKL